MSEFINQLALGIFGGVKRTLVQIYTLVSQNGLCGDYAFFVARRGMSNLRAFLGSSKISYIVYISQDLLYIVYISLEAFKKISLRGGPGVAIVSFINPQTAEK